MTSIILFVISMFVMAGLVASKVVEIKFNRTHFFAELLKSGDVKIHKLINLLVFKYNRYKKISRIFLFEFVPSYSYEILVKLKDYVSKKYYSAGDDFRGRRVLRSNGSVSFFLDQLTSDKTKN